MHAIRARSGQFRRSAILFTAVAWILISNPTPEQLNESRLEALEMRASDVDESGNYRGLPVTNPDEPIVMPDPVSIPDNGAAERLVTAEALMSSALAGVSREDGEACILRLAEKVSAAAESAKAPEGGEPDPVEVSPREKELIAMKMDELKTIAEPLGVTVAVGAKKTDVAKLIAAAESAKAPEATPGS